MTKSAKSSSKRGKDVTKEVLKDDEKWYGLEKKFWTVVEFGVYTILLTFTAVAFGIQYNILSSNNNVIIDDDAKNITAADDSFSYSIADMCENVECNTTLTASYKGEDLEVKYYSEAGSTTLELGNVKIETMNPLKEFALLSNGYVATVEAGEGRISYIRYYDKNGNEIKSYITYLDTTKLDDTKGVYGTCEIPDRSVGSDQRLSIVEYSIQSDGTFVENVIGTFDKSYCKD